VQKKFDFRKRKARRFGETDDHQLVRRVFPEDTSSIRPGRRLQQSRFLIVADR